MSYRDEDYRAYDGVNFIEHSGIDFSQYSLEELTKLWRQTLKKGMREEIEYLSTVEITIDIYRYSLSWLPRN